MKKNCEIFPKKEQNLRRIYTIKKKILPIVLSKIGPKKNIDYKPLERKKIIIGK
jgi:hypothetical protein